MEHNSIRQSRQWLWRQAMSVNSRIAALERRQPRQGRFFVVWPLDYEADTQGELTDEQRSQLRDGDSIIFVTYTDGAKP
jgi:hypothetical protein